MLGIDAQVAGGAGRRQRPVDLRGTGFSILISREACFFRGEHHRRAIVGSLRASADLSCRAIFTVPTLIGVTTASKRIFNA
jgi:hypothetical protein